MERQYWQKVGQSSAQSTSRWPTARPPSARSRSRRYLPQRPTLLLVRRRLDETGRETLDILPTLGLGFRLQQRFLPRGRQLADLHVGLALGGGDWGGEVQVQIRLAVQTRVGGRDI